MNNIRRVFVALLCAISSFACSKDGDNLTSAHRSLIGSWQTKGFIGGVPYRTTFTFTTQPSSDIEKCYTGIRIMQKYIDDDMLHVSMKSDSLTFPYSVYDSEFIYMDVPIFSTISEFESDTFRQLFGEYQLNGDILVLYEYQDKSKPIYFQRLK